MKNQYKLTALSSAVIAALTFATPLMAQEGNAQDDKEVVEQVAAEAGEEVVVRDTAAEAMTSFQQLNRQDIANRPQGNGNITDLLRSNPNVQFSNKSLNSLQMGNLKPADISIHGSFSYQNNFMIDGISANSDLDPARQSDYTNTRIASADEQGFYVDTSLVESVTVYDNNVPVEFGGFTGGVIDTQTRSWSGENHFKVFTRATEKGWGEMVFDPKLAGETGNASHPGQIQADYEKRTLGFTGEFGLSDSTGIVIGYTRRESKIPQYQDSDTYIGNLRIDPDADPMQYQYVFDTVNGLKGMKETKQISDTLFVKGTSYISDNTQLDLSFNYTSYEDRGFQPGFNASDFENKHDAYGVTANLKQQLKQGLWTSSVSYSILKDSRDSKQDYFLRVNDTEGHEYWIDDENMDWNRGTSVTTMYRGGGIGDLDATQNVFSLKTKLEFDPIQYQNTSQQFTIGAEFNQTDAEYKRDKDHYDWSVDRSHVTRHTDGSPEVEEEWQEYATTMRFRHGTHDADLQQIALFAQHTMEAGDWTFRTGVRGEYNDFTEEFNFAPRFTASWDVFGSNSTIATFGANRYYGRNILAYALYEAQNAGLERYDDYASPDVPAAEWTPAEESVGLNDLETPYDDELTLAITQRLPADWLANVTFVHRNGEKGIRSTQTGKTDSSGSTVVRHFKNTGKSEHDSVSFSLANTRPMQFLGADHHLRFSAAWQQTKTNQNLLEGYGDIHKSVESNGWTTVWDKVMLDGKIVNADDVDSTDFNIPIRLNLETTHAWHRYGLTWFNNFRWDASRDQILDKGVYSDYAGGKKQYRKYETVDIEAAWAWDTKLQYRPDWARGLEIAAEVTNVLNNKNVADVFWWEKPHVGDDGVSGEWCDIYEPGRQLWLEISYNY